MMNDLFIPHELRQYQVDGVNFLLSNSSALLADEMGLGKTVQVAVTLQNLLTSGRYSRALVVVPSSLKLNWEYELNRWAPKLSSRRTLGDAEDRQAYYQLPLNVVIASYDEVRIDSSDFLSNIYFGVVVLDEAQRIKNPNSQTAVACRILSRDRSWALTGTPLENKVGDLISIFRFVNRGLLRENYSLSKIHESMKPYFLRRTKIEVLPSLPPIIDQTVPIELQAQQRASYDAEWGGRWDGFEKRPSQLSEVELLGLITRLKKTCNYDPDSFESAKLDYLKTIMENLEAPDDKIIIFSQYVDTLLFLQSRLVGHKHFLFHGGMNSTERNIALEDFKLSEGPSILLMSLRAGGVGLNIQEASMVILFDRWWNPALESQAIHRAHRFGRERPLHVIRLEVVATVEEYIAQILKEKQELFNAYVDNAENAELQKLDKKSLLKILQSPE